LSEPPISTVSLDSVIFFEKAAFSPQFKQTAVSLTISSQSGIKLAISPNGLKRCVKKKVQTFSGKFRPTRKRQQFCLCLLILHKNLKYLGTELLIKSFQTNCPSSIPTISKSSTKSRAASSLSHGNAGMTSLS
jgi:hypothetical protein